jgi:hypothetical protein
MAKSSWYDTAQICKNGHLINAMAKSYPDSNQKFCQICGSETITNCENCKTPIRGSYHSSSMILLGVKFEIPKYCDNCGHSYPWTESKLQAAKQMVDLFEKLTPDEREVLKTNLDDLIRDSPQSEPSAYNFKKIMAKVGKESAGIMRGILVDIVSESIKKIIWP